MRKLADTLFVVACVLLIGAFFYALAIGFSKIQRDDQRIADMGVIIGALEQYVNENSDFPETIPDSCGLGWDAGPCGSSKTFIPDLVTSGYLSTVPTDPIGNSGNHYSYYHYKAGAFNCDRNRGSFFVLGIRNLETKLKAGSSPGWQCLDRDWQDEFDWVFGAYVK